MPKRPTILVSGGAGYLGRCVADVLWAKGFAPVCLDDFSTSHPFKSANIPCHKIDLTDAKALDKIWKKLPPLAGIIHFAARALVSESVEKPAEYFRNNLGCTINLAEKASEMGIPLVHSSSCTVYGIPTSLPLDERMPRTPISPYGETKKMGEDILDWFSKAKGLRCLNLRYFNPAGSLSGAQHGESHEPETHLIPNVVRAGLTGKRVTVFGTKHPTPDGTAVRDYIHVADLAVGHLQGLEFLKSTTGPVCEAINLGSGKGSSVLEVIEAAEKVIGKKIGTELKEARPGDPPALVASIEKAEKVLGFSPKHSLDEILGSAVEWEKKRNVSKSRYLRNKGK